MQGGKHRIHSTQNCITPKTSDCSVHAETKKESQGEDKGNKRGHSDKFRSLVRGKENGEGLGRGGSYEMSVSG
jgi:hypothetical protein